MIEKLLQETEVIAAIAGAVVGAVAGGLVGFLSSFATTTVTNFLRSRGKLFVFNNNSKIELTKWDGFGNFREVTAIKEAERASLTIEVDIYNQAYIPKTIGDFRVELTNRKTIKTLSTSETHWTGSGIPYLLIVPTRTIMPKSSENIKCTVFVKPEDIVVFKSDVIFNLIATFPDKKVFRAKVFEFNLADFT